MKIIAKMSERVALCEVSEEEIALLHGFKSSYTTGYIHSTHMAIGREIDVGRMANVNNYVRTMDKTVLSTIRTRLEEGIKGIDAALNEVSKLTIFETLKETE